MQFTDKFTVRLKGAKAFLQVGIGVATNYDETVLNNVERHQVTIRQKILQTLSSFALQEIQGSSGRDNLIRELKLEINEELTLLEGYGGIGDVFFTSFIVQ